MKSLNLYFKIFDFVARERVKKKDLELRRIHTQLATVLSTGLLMWSYAWLAYTQISSPIPGLIGFACCTVHLLSPLLFRVSSNTFFISNTVLTAGLIHQGVFAFFTGGFESPVLIWFGILPVLAGVMDGRRSALLWAGITSLWAGIYLVLNLQGFETPMRITEDGMHVAQALIIFGWIYLGTCLIYVNLTLNENQERKLSEQSTKIDDLFRVLFHDLAGPLSRVMIGLSISKKNASPQNKEHGIEIATKASDTMLEITQTVRRMYAVTKGKMDNDLNYHSLNEAISYVQRIYEGDLSSKNIIIKYDFEKHQNLMVYVEPVSFKNQVLGNVISNAIKFSAPGSHIHIDAYEDNHFLVIEITDQGIGIPKSILDSLFDVTKKTSRPGTMGESGTGFGMHIMKSFMELYQGKIKVESEEESAGTKIKLFLKSMKTQEGVVPS